ncbi:MAG: HAD family phosphatase [Caldilineaceae bacterium]|nr:HAD family phosphatase [Caldilineaceae bacterium]
MQQIAAVDLDDTLLRSDGTLSPQTLTMIERWQRAGRRIVIATGRPPRSIGRSLPDELQSVPWVCYNGAEIRLENQPIYQNLVPAEDVYTILNQIREATPDLLVGVEVDDVLYLNRTANRTTPYQVADLFSLAQPAAKVLLFSENAEALARLTFAVPPSARILYSARYPHFIQIIGCRTDKAEALRALVSEWNMQMSDVVAFGDDTNDVDMVRLSGLGVAVANAVDEVKTVADCVTASNNEDGVALVLARLLEQAA